MDEDSLDDALTPWMLSAFHRQELRRHLAYPLGLRPATFHGRPREVLLVKVPKEAILTAKVRKGFKVYPVPIDWEGTRTLALVSAFFDDSDEPMIVCSPLIDDTDSAQLVKLLLLGQIDVHFFNELNQELLGYEATVRILGPTRDLIESSVRLHPSTELAESMWHQVHRFMAARTTADDAAAIDVSFVDAIFPEDLFFLDVVPSDYEYHGGKGFRHTTLERENPETSQELDIIGLLQKRFSPQTIFHGPARVTDGKEIADVVVVTQTHILLIQAKDSPNTEAQLNNTMERKKASTRKNLAKAVSQAAGAIRYIRAQGNSLAMVIDGRKNLRPIGERQLFSLVIVRELFMDDRPSYSSALLELAAKSGVPSVMLDYPELSQCMANLRDGEAFFNALLNVYQYGVQNGLLPRMQFEP